MFSWSSWEFGLMLCCNQESYNNAFKQRNIPCKWKDYFIFVRLTGTLEYWIWTSHLNIIGMTAIVSWKIHLAQYLAFNNGHSWRLRSTWAQDGVIFPISKLPGFPKLTVASMVSWLSNSPSFVYFYFEPIKTCGIRSNQWVWVSQLCIIQKKFFSFNIICLPDHFISCPMVYVLWIVNNHE